MPWQTSRVFYTDFWVTLPSKLFIVSCGFTFGVHVHIPQASDVQAWSNHPLHYDLSLFGHYRNSDSYDD